MTDTKPGRRAWSTWRAATDILNTAAGSTPIVEWAAGAKVLHHSIELAAIWAGRHPLDGEYGGGGTLDGRRYEIRSGLFAVEQYGRGGDMRTVIAVRTRAVEALVAEDRVPAELVDACRKLHVERRRLSGITQDHSQRYMRGRAAAPSRDEVLAHGAAWGDIERRCTDAAADVWQHVRPRSVEQLGLFALAGGAS